jgi:hypothetical protein
VKVSSGSRRPACDIPGAACALLIGLLASAGATAADRYEGLAYSKADGRLVYREFHWRYDEEGQPARLVVYRCADGTPFARKRVRAAGSASAPAFEFVDGRDGYREGVRGDGGEREVFVQAQRDSGMQTRVLRVGPGSVIDAGFDELIRRHWDALLAGDSIAADFLLPSRFDFLGISIRRTASPDGNDGTVRLRMKLDAWYGIVAPQTDLAYRASDRWLLRFEGIGSIRDARGRNQAVRIEFPAGLHVVAVDRAEVDAALALPLSGQCDG